MKESYDSYWLMIRDNPNDPIEDATMCYRDDSRDVVPSNRS